LSITEASALVPGEIRSSRIVLRRWRPSHAQRLHPLLESNWEFVRPWIPARAAEPVAMPQLIERLDAFVALFDEDKEWRFGMFAADDDTILGELCLFPRSQWERVPYSDSDRIELGYWLRADRTGQGLVTEAVRAAMTLTATLPRCTRLEIRCDARNAPSGAVPRRLGFVLAGTIERPGVNGEPSSVLQVWAFP
jgi:RimJ/RimL family protein N-acetyltransferase